MGKMTAIRDDNKKLAYILRMENCLNFDIDYGFTPHQIRRMNLRTNEYYYKDSYGDGGGDEQLSLGVTCMSRLEGIRTLIPIGKNKDVFVPKKLEKLMVCAVHEFTQAINRCGHFVHFRVVGIDVYRRVVVRLYDPVSGRCLNDIFLQDKYNTLFEPYTSKHSSTRGESRDGK